MKRDDGSAAQVGDSIRIEGGLIHFDPPATRCKTCLLPCAIGAKCDHGGGLLLMPNERRSTPRKGDWMQTSHGRQFWPLDPRPEEIHIDDIAAALSKMCRYGGHCKRFYSVAEHCVLMANAAPSEHALDALLHDASEAYLADVIRPIKSSLTNYHAIEAALERVIAQRFGTCETMPAEVKRLDNAILADEMQQNMATPPADWRLPEPPLGVTLGFWSPEKAEFEFLAAFRRYGGHWC